MNGWRSAAPDPSVWATVRVPARPSIAEHNPATVRWRGLMIDPDLVGLAPGRARPSSIVFSDGGDEWSLPLDGLLPAALAWHPRRSLVAGLAVRRHRAYVWTADYRARTVTVHHHLRAAVSFTAYGHPPVAWCGDDRLVLLTPVPDGSDDPRPPDGRPVVFEAEGPGIVSFEPPVQELERLASARVTVAGLKPGSDTGTALTPPLLVRSLIAVPTDNTVLVGRGHWSAGEENPCWADIMIELDGGDGPRPVPPDSEYARLLAPWPGTVGATVEPGVTARPVTPITTGFGTATLELPAAETGPLLLWIRAFPPDGDAPCPAPVRLSESGHPVAVLDLPLHWPADATLDVLHAQIIGAVEAARKLWTGSVSVGGHSFGATLALYALAHIPDLVSAVAHSGCYNRTLTATGFHHERRPYWADPQIYQAFSALHFADLLDRPVLLVHGAEDGNPATPPEQSLQLYRAIIATGGRARLVLLPFEGHTYLYRESHRAVAAEHRAWMARW